MSSLQLGRRAPIAPAREHATHDLLDVRYMISEVCMSELKRIQHIHAEAQRKLGWTDADGKWQLGSPTAATTRRPRTSRATSGVPLMHRTMPAIYGRRFSTTPTRRKSKQWKPTCGPG